MNILWQQLFEKPSRVCGKTSASPLLKYGHLYRSSLSSRNLSTNLEQKFKRKKNQVKDKYTEVDEILRKMMNAKIPSEDQWDKLCETVK